MPSFPLERKLLHPAQKPTQVSEPILGAFCEPSGIVLDHPADMAPPFSPLRPWAAGSGIELDLGHYLTASNRIQPAPNLRQAE